MSDRERNNTSFRKAENWSKILQMSKTMQMRYTLIPESCLNRITVAGIRDITLGRIKDGIPVGGNVVRFNNPSPNTKSDFHRICIDPKGFPDSGNPHIRVSPGVVGAAVKVQKGLEIGGKALLVISLVASASRIGKAIYDEVTIDDEIEALEHIVSCLEEDLEDDQLSNRAKTQKHLNQMKKLLAEAYDNQKHPGKKTLVTILTIEGECLGSATLALAGAKTGALLGAAGGPIGSIAGAVTGSIAGAIAGSELGRSAVENFKCDEKGISTKMNGSIFDWGEKSHGEIIGVRGNASIGEEGLELGGGLALLDIGKKDEASFSMLKAGSNLNITNKGVNIGLESKVIRAEVEDENVKVGVGFNLDTGVQITSDGAKLEILGFGISAGEDGVGFKLPFFDVKFKS